MKFSQMLRGITPPPPPIGIGKVHRLESRELGISKELLRSRHDSAAKQIFINLQAMLGAIEQGASSYREISDKSGVNKTTVKQRIPMLADLKKVRAIAKGQGKPVKTTLLDPEISIDEVYEYMLPRWTDGVA